MRVARCDCAASVNTVADDEVCDDDELIDEVRPALDDDVVNGSSRRPEVVNN
jgi:hypothetical protein